MPSHVELARFQPERVAPAAAEVARPPRRARSPPARRARSRRARSLRPASRAPARWCRTPATSRLRRPRRSAHPARACSSRRRGDRPRPSTPAPAQSSWRRGQTTMKSWMSTRRPACAPPPKIWICGIGSSVGIGAAEVLVQRHAVRRGRRMRRGHRHRERRVGAEAGLSGVPSSSISRRRARPGRRPRCRSARVRSRR